MGTCNDADGLNQVVGGKIVWPGGQPGGEIVWCELRDQVQSEFTGRIFSGDSSTDPINIQATYVSNWNGLTQGSIQLTSRQPGYAQNAPQPGYAQNAPLIG